MSTSATNKSSVQPNISHSPIQPRTASFYKLDRKRCIDPFSSCCSAGFSPYVAELGVTWALVLFIAPSHSVVPLQLHRSSTGCTSSHVITPEYHHFIRVCVCGSADKCSGYSLSRAARPRKRGHSLQVSVRLQAPTSQGYNTNNTQKPLCTVIFN